MVPRLLKGASVTLKPQKCAFLRKGINYLGRIIPPGPLKTPHHTANVACKLKALTTVIELRSFLGLCNLFRRFVPKFTRIASSSSRRPKKTLAKVLGPLDVDKLHASYISKDKLISPLVLFLTRQNEHYTLDAEAYDKK